MDLIKQENNIAYYRVVTSTDVKAVHDAVKQSNLLGYEARTSDGRCFKFNEDKSRIEKTDGIVYFKPVDIPEVKEVEPVKEEVIPEVKEVAIQKVEVITPEEIKENKLSNFKDKILRLRDAYRTLLTQNIECKKQLAEVTNQVNELKANNEALSASNKVLSASNEVLSASNEDLKKELEDNKQAVEGLDEVMADFEL